MKTRLTLIMLIILLVKGYSQQGINYKALIKDTNGNVLSASPVSLQFIIYEGAALTNNVYQESHTTNTNANGLVIVNIGEGTTADNFTTLNWSSDQHFLNVQVNTGTVLIDLGTTEFKSVPYAKVADNVNGLEALDEGNGVGWRLVGKNPDNYGDIGDHAIDLSEAEAASSTLGSTGNYSSAFGVNVTASGLASTAFGIATNALGNISFAMGSGSTASGDYSTAFGQSSTASGNFSTVFGSSNEASGDFSTAIGRGLTTNYHSTSIGRYNNGGGNETEWLDQDPLFEIGNGTSNGDRNNALTIYKNGEQVINSDFVGLNISAQNAGIFISNSLTGILINNPEQNGIGVTSAGFSGGSFTGQTTGVFAQSSIAANPDIILGGDSGIVSSSTNTSSDFHIRSNDDVIIELDSNNDESGTLRIKDSNNIDVLAVNEFGTIDMAGTLRIDGKSITDGGSDILAISSSLVPLVDNDDRLGGPNRRWQDVYAANGMIQTSDRRSKTNIANLEYGLEEVLKMLPVSFNWKNKNNPDTKLGLIAQNLQTLVPEVVQSHIWEKDDTTGVLTKKELDRLGVYYSDLVPVLIKAIQEQQKIIDVEKSINAKQNSKLEALMARVEDLETKQSN